MKNTSTTSLDLTKASEALAEFKLHSKEIYGKSEIAWWAPPKGNNSESEIRVIKLLLPPNNVHGTHWGILEGRDDKRGGSIRCPLVYDKSPCPICEMVEMKINSNDEEEVSFAKKRQVQFRYPMIIMDMAKDADKSLKIYEAPRTVYQSIIDFSTKPKYAPIVDLDNGRNINLSKTKDGRFVKYNVVPDFDRSRVNIEESKIPDLLEILKPRSYEDIQYALINGSFPAKDESVDLDESEVRKPNLYKQGLPNTKLVDEDLDVPENFEHAPKETIQARPIQSRQPEAVSASKNRNEDVQKSIKEKLEQLQRMKKNV